MSGERPDRRKAGRGTTLLAVRHATKWFGGNPALRDVSLSVDPGEIHGLVGENGSGKSTLIKILAGYHTPDDATEVAIAGSELRLPVRPADAYQAGLRFVHQELGLVDTMTVLENVAAGHYDARLVGRIDWRAERRALRADLRRFEVRLDPDALISGLTGAERAMVAVMRGARERGDDARDRQIFILDEPTTYLSHAEVERLFTFLRRVAASGNGVVLVTHRLSEVLSLCQRVSILRDGELVATRDTDGLSANEIVELMVGRPIETLDAVAQRPDQGKTRLGVRELAGDVIDGLNFELASGEVLGMTGLAGMGQDEVPYLLYGAKRRRAGRIAIDGVEQDVRSPRVATGLGMALLPADRAHEGIIPAASVRENTTLPVISQLFRRGHLSRKAEASLVQELLGRYRVVPRRSEPPVGDLSGGNQQKALVAKWFNTNPRILILHQPTQGVDVASREAIFGFIGEIVTRGASVVVCSTDHEELARLCNRVLIVRDGRVIAELKRQNLSVETIGHACHGGGADRVAA